MTRINVTLHEGRDMFLREMIQAKLSEIIRTNILCSKTFFFENHAVYDPWKNCVEPIRPKTTYHMHFACWIPKAIKTLLEFVNIAFPLQQWFHERPSLLRYTLIAYLVLFNLNGRDSSDN
jgi:hypothetical protein